MSQLAQVTFTAASVNLTGYQLIGGSEVGDEADARGIGHTKHFEIFGTTNSPISGTPPAAELALAEVTQDSAATPIRVIKRLPFTLVAVADSTASLTPTRTGTDGVTGDYICTASFNTLVNAYNNTAMAATAGSSRRYKWYAGVLNMGGKSSITMYINTLRST